MNDANNAGTLLPCPFCNQQFLTCFNGSGNPDTKAWILECSSCAVSFHADNNETQEEVLEWWNTRVLPTPNAPVEREAIARIIDPAAPFDDIEGVTWSRFDLARRDIALSTADKIATILAVRLDEAAIRKDEREKCAKIVEAEQLHYAAIIQRRESASAIRNGGKQP